ncbi:MAG TPA: M56 family metallopeptidase [Gemmatimonadaceae bacterium]
MTPSTISGFHLPLLLPLAKATIILVAALGITFGMQRASAGARHLVWLVTLVALVLVPALNAWAPLRLAILPEVERAPAPTASATILAPIRDRATIGRATSSPAATAERGQSAVRADPSTNGPSTTDAARPRPNTAMILIALWAGVLIAIGLSLAYAALAVRRIVRRARPITERAWLDALYEVSDRLGLDEVPRVLRSDEAKMPFACGILTPTIVLPVDCDRWSADRRRAVLLHELAHIRRRDLIGHTLGRLVCAVYWFHPLVWTAAKRLRAESERACDDLALACGTRAADYAEHLLDIVTSVRGDATPVVALAMARRKEFEGRMLAILDKDVRHSTPSRRQSAALTVTLAVIAVVVGAAAPAPRAVQAPWTPAPAQVTQPRLNVASTPSRDARPAPVTVHVRVDPTPAIAASSSTEMSAATSTLMSAAAKSSANVAPAATAQSDSDDRPALLAKVLRTDTSAVLRRVAAWGLRDYAEQSVAAEALANALRHDANASVREMAAWSLADCGSTSAAADALTAALRGDSNEQVRATAAWALGHSGRAVSIDALVAALGDANKAVRLRTAWALGAAEPREAPPALVALLHDKDADTRTLAAWSLFRIKDPRTAPALETALKSEADKDVQVAEIRAVAALGERSVDALRGLLESPDPRVKAMAVRALAGGHAAGPWPWPWPDPRPFP